MTTTTVLPPSKTNVPATGEPQSGAPVLPAFLKGLLTYVRDLCFTHDGEMLVLATQRLLFYTVCAAFVGLVGALTSIWVLIVIALFTFFGK